MSRPPERLARCLERPAQGTRINVNPSRRIDENQNADRDRLPVPTYRILAPRDVQMGLPRFAILTTVTDSRQRRS
jgi:hypothetical protein